MTIEEPMLTDSCEGKESEVTLGEYLSFWGDGGYHAPFYNYFSEGNDLGYLRDDLLPLVEEMLTKHKLGPLERENFETIKEFLEQKIKDLEAGKEVSSVLNDSETFQQENCVKITYDQVRKANKGERFTMRLVGEDYEAFAKAVNQGIDSRLQACFCPDRGDKVDGNKITISEESLPVLIRRLFEGDERMQDLATGMMTTLGFSDVGVWTERE